ncbi:uncharacterized protein MELLADRAFT_61977 [Melampsora larici-populina 98AG31]|uniref:Uncharacterized protein n=1 Tax=Melampsora larici-populina (strain 98AG31 / pathotype 3-4-7) TaxID=747676 RepID=F4RHI6_MELLP|nr:uncharacterized protein MELLADRAFT_61977 [Melampsora larici-populina 98AG31]EGG08180.1 hypothetical protein MELLADRAFT_61977 [Melampsora larici-populina 98AG31]
MSRVEKSEQKFFSLYKPHHKSLAAKQSKDREMTKQKVSAPTQRTTRMSSRAADESHHESNTVEQDAVLVDEDTSFHEDSNGSGNGGEEEENGVGFGDGHMTEENEEGAKSASARNEQAKAKEPIQLVLKNGRFVNLNPPQVDSEGDSSEGDSEDTVDVCGPSKIRLEKKFSGEKKKERKDKGKSLERVAWLEEIVREVKSGHLNRVKRLQKRFYDKYGDEDPAPSPKGKKPKKVKIEKSRPKPSKPKRREKKLKKGKGKKKRTSDSSSSSSDLTPASDDSDSPAP